jgi:Peptidase inhibitor family I36
MNFRSHLRSGRSRVRAAVIVAAAAPALATAMLALPATAAKAASCSYPHVCTWQNSNYGGTQWNYSTPVNYWWYVSNAANDQISSIESESNKIFYIAKDCPAGSQWTWIGPYGTASNLANNKWPDGTGMNDSISAWAITSATKATFPPHGSRPAGGC